MAIMGSEEEVQELISDHHDINIIAITSPNQIAVGGLKTSIDLLLKKLEYANRISTVLALSSGTNNKFQTETGEKIG